ncbi:ATP-binding cassette domain-containing protein [Qiania dongpingensis]|uniref:UvrABC system protein A n=1 Tax=Qiania dongpingensis TaxID=2763669 RepID=A0A7G9G6J3_9FIRM|nr:excinuclease ABC subunit UvrA [Qiania dongpingensis]QNM06425.1 excinuclease ABC subunit UvrA [Qiania dongpingensis]
MKDIEICGASHGNLKHISVSIPRNKLVVLTGLSGSGKTTLAVDVLYQECQRQYLEAISYQGINKPDVEAVKNASPAIVIGQEEKNINPRSSLGTSTDIYTDLRMLFEKLGVRTCPGCGKLVDASVCREEVKKTEDDFIVYMYCSHCGHKMEKLTRSHFSFNTRKGACAVCSGLGKVWKPDLRKILNPELSLESGAVTLWKYRYKDYQLELLRKVFTQLGISLDFQKPLRLFQEKEMTVLLYGTESPEFKTAFGDIKTDRFEGILPSLWRKLEEKSGQSNSPEEFFSYETCPVCRGERLKEDSRNVTVNGVRLPQLSEMPLDELSAWLRGLENKLDIHQKGAAVQYLTDLKSKVDRLIRVGLGYLHLDRQTMTLSGGEKRRVKLSAALDSDLTGILYILDEPTVGLHPKDTEGVVRTLKELRDKENTILVIEHDEDVIRAADHIIDMGPGSGRHGGSILAAGDYPSLLRSPASITGNYFRTSHEVRRTPRSGNGRLEIRHADSHNVVDIDVCFPTGCLTVVTGVSGAGKSSLVFGALAEHFTGSDAVSNQVIGSDSFDRLITVRQSSLTTMKRSNIATYTGAYDELRALFGRLPESMEKGFGPKDFSFNTGSGRCETCGGLGYVVSNMLFFQDVEVICPACGGSRFIPELLAVKYLGHSINDILRMSVNEAAEMFPETAKLARILSTLKDIGLGYLELGQPLTTLSGGEKQRLKLAVELFRNRGKKNLYLIDEPTVGLHPLDVENLMALFDKMVEHGNTVIVIEHNLQVIRRADWIIDMGPGGGSSGGKIVACGTPFMIKNNPLSATGRYL